MARQFFVETGQPERRNVIARRQSYHGNTLGALAAGGNEWRRAQFRPLLIDTHHIDPCYAYRYQEAGESEEAYGLRAAQALEDKILELGPDTVMAFVAEPVVGATAGAVPAVAGYFRRIREICDRHGVLLILDEVMCGMGRTGTLHACEQDGVAPDLMTIAKGLGGGYQPIGAVLLSRRIFDAFAEGSGFFQHGHTYMCHPMACAAALAVQEVIARDRPARQRPGDGRASRRGASASGSATMPMSATSAAAAFSWGSSWSRTVRTKEPFDPKRKLNAKIKREAMARGLLVYPAGGTIDGVRGDHVLLAPPFIVDAAAIDAIVERLGDADRRCRGLSARSIRQIGAERL